jgi:hypothetical protein
MRYLWDIQLKFQLSLYNGFTDTVLFSTMQSGSLSFYPMLLHSVSILSTLFSSLFEYFERYEHATKSFVNGLLKVVIHPRVPFRVSFGKAIAP